MFAGVQPTAMFPSVGKISPVRRKHLSFLRLTEVDVFAADRLRRASRSRQSARACQLSRMRYVPVIAGKQDWVALDADVACQPPHESLHEPEVFQAEEQVVDVGLGVVLDAVAALHGPGGAFARHLRGGDGAGEDRKRREDEHCGGCGEHGG